MTQQTTDRPERMPLPPPLAYMKNVLRDYYRDHIPAPPARFGRREFGFIFWPSRPGPPPFVRHLGYRRRDEYRSVFTRRVPWHAYYSTAFYQEPAARTMAEKGWLGAELIFDLDADHLPDAKEMTFGEQLAAVKVEFKKLLDEFVFGDFGFDEDDVFLTFSGGRGYHCHVIADSVMPLDARARRQIADYVTGKNVAERELIWTETRRIKERGFEKESKHLHFPKPDEPGWRGRVGRGVLQVIDEVRALPYEHAIERLTRYDGIGPSKAEAFLERIRDKRVVERMREGHTDQGDAIRVFLSKEAVARGVVELGEGETDEPVTADVKRLIRLPDSLHGKTGLRVVELRTDELDAFDPLTDAVALPTDAHDRVVAERDVTFELLGQTFRLGAGDPQPLPRAAAFFAVARRLAVPAD